MPEKERLPHLPRNLIRQRRVPPRIDSRRLKMFMPEDCGGGFDAVRLLDLFRAKVPELVHAPLLDSKLLTNLPESAIHRGWSVGQTELSNLSILGPKFLLLGEGRFSERSLILPKEFHRSPGGTSR